MEHRLEASTAASEYMRHCVKILNSKDEILANGAIDTEMGKMWKLTEIHKKPLRSVITILERMFAVGRIFTLLAKGTALSTL